MTNAFAVLSLPVRYDLRKDDIQARYHHEVALWHPDRATSAIEKTVATQHSRLLNEAYQKLMNPAQRADEILKAKEWQTTPPGPDFFGWILDQDAASFQNEWERLAKDFDAAIHENNEEEACKLYGRMMYIWPRIEGR